MPPAPEGDWWCGRGGRAAGSIPGCRACVSPWPTPASAWSRTCASRVFEAFFTTKETTGTGLGLWVSHEIILKHRGIVHVRSRAGGPGSPSGTVFQIFLPDNEKLITLARPSLA